MVCNHATVKCYHEALALHNKYPQYELHLSYLNHPEVFSPQFSSLLEYVSQKLHYHIPILKGRRLFPKNHPFQTINYCWPPTRLNKLLKTLEPDVIHTFNPYNCFLTAYHQRIDSTPIIHDAEDLATCNINRTNKQLQEERRILQLPDGVVFTSKQEYQTLHQQIQGHIYLFPYVSQSTLPNYQPRKLSVDDGEIHAVYVGSMWKGGYRDFLTYLINLTSFVHVHLYLTNQWGIRFHQAKQEAETKPHFHMEPVIPFNQVIPTLMQYNYGLVPFPPNRKMQYSYGMKTLDYQYAQILPLFRSNSLITNLNNQKPIGYHLKNPQEIINIPKTAEKQLLGNFDHTYHLMETHIHKLHQLYQTVLN